MATLVPALAQGTAQALAGTLHAAPYPARLQLALRAGTPGRTGRQGGQDARADRASR
jgi:hypothetical protein